MISEYDDFMDNKNIDKVISILKKEVKRLRVPIVTEVSWDKNPNQKVIVLTNKSAVRQWAKEFQKLWTLLKKLI